VSHTRSIVECHLKPHLGHLDLAKLTTADIDDFYAHLANPVSLCSATTWARRRAGWLGPASAETASVRPSREIRAKLAPTPSIHSSASHVVKPPFPWITTSARNPIA
jgi:hypothetical protein